MYSDDFLNRNKIAHRIYIYVFDVFFLGLFFFCVCVGVWCDMRMCVENVCMCVKVGPNLAPTDCGSTFFYRMSLN